MQAHLAVFNSDQPNAYGICMPPAVLCAALEQGWLLGQPLILSHDRHRLEGWTRALGMHLETGLARLTGLCYTPDDDDEGEQLRELLFRFLGRQLAAEVEPYRQDLEERLRPHPRGTQRPVYVSCAALLEDGLAERAFPDVFANRDKDGLVPLASLHAIAPGVFERGGLLFFASSLLRRSLSRHNTLNDALLSRLHDLAQNGELTVKVRLDADLVGLARTYATPLEFAYWWGPKFDDDLLSIPTGITRHEADERLRLFSGASRTEFWWHEQNDLKTLECEEVRDLPSLGHGPDHYGCRYAHSIVDPTSAAPNHLDGAVRLYDEEKMLARLDKNIFEAGRHSQYVKLWRVDGPLAVHTWKEVITHHFRDNELVGEYFGGKDESGHLRPELLEPPADPLAKYVPCNMAPGDGVRVSVAYHLPPEAQQPPVAVLPLDTFGTAEQRTPYVEADTFEVIKLLRRQGIAVSVPAGTARLAFEDTSANLGLLVHAGSQASELAGRMLGVVTTLCDAWVRRGDDRTVSFNIGITYDDRMVYYSFAGHVVDLATFLHAISPTLPAAAADIGPWIEAASRALNTLFRPSGDRPPLRQMMQQTGILQFHRRSIDRSLYTFEIDDQGRPAVAFAIPRERTDLIELLEAGQLSWARVHIVERSSCSVCRRDYLDCNCSKYLDEPVQQVMECAPLCDLFWTNRPASGRIHMLAQ